MAGAGDGEMTAEDVRSQAALMMRGVLRCMGAAALQDLYAEVMIQGDPLPSVRVASERDGIEAWERLPQRIKDAIASPDCVRGLANALECGVRPEVVMAWALDLASGSIANAQWVMRQAMILAKDSSAHREAPR